MTLILDLLRHGEALPSSGAGDAARPLSPRGRSDITRLAEQFSVEGLVPTHVFVSPLRRARETVALLLRPLPESPAPIVLESLTPDSEPEEVLEALAAHGVREGHAVLVSHQPLLGRLAALLTGQDTAFAPASLVRIRCEDGPGWGRLVFSIHPAGRS